MKVKNWELPLFYGAFYTEVKSMNGDENWV